MCEKRPVPARTRRADAQVQSSRRGTVNGKASRAARRLLNQVSPPPCGRGGSMKPNSLLLLTALLAAAPACAAGTLQEKANAKAAAHAALGDSAGEPDVKATPPTLPTQASDRAREVQSTIAFGKKGAAHSQAGQRAADQAGDESADRSAQGAAASAAKSANADSHAAAGLARAAAARNGLPPGTPPPGRK